MKTFLKAIAVLIALLVGRYLFIAAFGLPPKWVFGLIVLFMIASLMTDSRRTT